VAIGLVAWFGTRRISFIDESYYLVATAGLLFLFAQQVTTLRRAQKVQAVSELRTARLELELLKRQLQPHFLMNSLTAVTEWIESDPQTGVRMIEALANELRALAAMSGKMLVPLAEEIQLCRQHLQVMGYRKDRAFTLVTPSVDGTQRVPPAIFHTLIENAVTHNSYARGAELRLDASDSTNGRVTYQLRSPFERSTWAGGEGRGHAYVRARLQEAFGDRWSFTSGPDGADWVDTIDIPKA
jgi:LytS/YehU family sensor histidine kinase